MARVTQATLALGGENPVSQEMNSAKVTGSDKQSVLAGRSQNCDIVHAVPDSMTHTLWPRQHRSIFRTYHPPCCNDSTVEQIRCVSGTSPQQEPKPQSHLFGRNAPRELHY